MPGLKITTNEANGKENFADLMAGALSGFTVLISTGGHHLLNSQNFISPIFANQVRAAIGQCTPAFLKSLSCRYACMCVCTPLRAINN